MVESAFFTFYRNYIAFPQPMDTTADTQPRKESIVISASIRAANPEKPNFVLGRILVDTGSSVDLIYYKTLEKMRLTKMDLMAIQGNLQNFSRDQVYPMGLIRLTVTVGKVEVDTLFHVDSPDPFTAILGRP